MKNIVVGCALLALTAGLAPAQAATLKFDGLVDIYDQSYLAAGMTANGQVLTYTEAGFEVTLHTANSVEAMYGAHIGDGTYTSQTFNWHDGANNANGAYVTLMRVGGGSFNLNSFDYAASGSFTVTSGAYMIGLGAGASNVAANFLGVNSVSFYGPLNNELDNIDVSAAVPEPASWAMMLGGFGLIGGALRRRRIVRIA